MPFAIMVIIMAILFSLFRALTPWATQYKGEVEQHLSALVGQPVIISSMETSWYWFEPVLRLNQVTVSDSNDHALKLTKLLVGINLFSSLLHWHLQPGILYVDDVHLILRQVNDRWQIDGLRQDKEVTTLESDAYLPVLSWILGQQKIIVKNISAMVHLNDGTLLPLTALNLTAINKNGHYRLKAEAKLAQTMATELLVLADLNLNPYALNKISGHAYMSVRRFLPTQWQLFFPKANYHIDGGRGDFEVWLDMAKGHFSGLQSNLHFRRIVWSKTGHPQRQLIQSLKANLAWKPTKDGWQLAGDQIKFRAGDVRWPENALLITHQRTPQTYRLFFKNLLLAPLWTADIEWPDSMQPILAAHPSGQLYDTQIETKDGNLNYVLTRFAGFGWEKQAGIPDVRNISGVLNWQPTGGRLELDGQNTTITPRGLPAITLLETNAAFAWKTLSQGLQISMERLVLNHPDFALSAEGALDLPQSPASQTLRLTAAFSADHADQFLAYIPIDKKSKPKLESWLKHDIKRIDKVIGQLNVNGPLVDFPFDKQPGEFSIKSHLSGVDLLFNKEWPLVRDLDGYLQVNNRDMNVDVLHASLNGIEATEGNVRVTDMGLDKETLLVHAKSDVFARILKHYIFSSPLRKSLSKLKKLDIEGPLGFDLNLEVPLYPENDEILAHGTLTFDDNQATFHHALNDVQFNHVSGALAFNEHGVTDSELSAKFVGDPIAMHIKSFHKPQPYTAIKIEGETTIDVLRQKFDLPIFTFMKGHLNLTSTLTLTDDPKDLDSMQIDTSLAGVSIDLPSPLGKSAEQLTPLAIKFDFNPEKAGRLRLDYNNQLKGDLWFTSQQESLILDRGEFRIGERPVLSKKQAGITIIGSLPNVNVEQWHNVWSKLPSNMSSPTMMDKIQAFDLKMGDVAFWEKNYKNVSVQGNKLNKDTWAVKLDQHDIAGDLQYEPSSNTLSGTFTRLYLAKMSLIKKQHNTQAVSIRPGDIPQLNLNIDVLKLGEIDVGSVSLKSTSSEGAWHLEQCNIKTPEYQLTMSGDWKQSGGKDTSNVQADLQINKFEEGLQRFKMTPAVEAHKGVMQFKGDWPGAINDFSLTNINGTMYLGLQNGRITNLSRETEEKLGLGKLLSILSLQTIPRRLKLDFSDLSNPGYSFDTFKGNFTVKNGVMNTTDSFIDGPVAYASMKGDLDVVKQLYDLELHISPHITASLPIVATIAGGPIAGAAAWVASKIINQGMQQVTGYTYKVSGPWLDPEVKQISIYKKKITKR